MTSVAESVVPAIVFSDGNKSEKKREKEGKNKSRGEERGRGNKDGYGMAH